MKNKEIMKRSVVAFFIFMFLATNAFLLVPPKKVVAQGLVADLAEACVGGLVKTILGDEIAEALSDATNWVKDQLGLGVLNDKVPTDDSKTQGQIKLSTLELCLTAVKEIAIRIAREILKKQLLDQIVDQTVNWIQNGETPRFTTNFGDMFNEAVDAGLGETIREIGLGEFCDGPVKAKIRINLTKPARFYERSSCTLSKVVGNIEAFKESFKNGGWIGIQEAISPQNNRHGVYLLAMEKMLEDSEAKERATQAETASAGGFQPQKICTRWALMTSSGIYWLETPGNPSTWIIHTTESDKEHQDPNNPPNNLHADKIAIGGKWQCENTQIITPTQTIADATSKAVSSDIDYILNAEDLETYASAILDAAINRLTKDSVTGLVKLTTKTQEEHQQNISNASAGVTSATKGETMTPGIERGIRAQLSQQAGGLSTILNQASTTLDTIKKTNNELIKTLDNTETPRGLTQCIGSNVLFGVVPSTFSPNQKVAEGLTRKNSWIPQEVQEIAQTKQSLTQFLGNLNGGSVSTQTLSESFRSLQETIGGKNTEYQTELSQVTTDKTIATTNRDLCNNGGNVPN